MTELGRRVLIGLALLAVVLLLYVALPFAAALLVAAVLAGVFSPWFERLAEGLGRRRTLAGGLFVTAVVFAVVLPLAGLTFAVAQQAEDALRPMRAVFLEKGVSGFIDGLPDPLPYLAREIMSRLPRGQQQAEELVRDLTGRILGGVGYLFVATGALLFQLSMMLVAFFFMLVDGPTLVRWITRASPLTDAQMNELFSDFRAVSVAVLAGSLGTALVQTVVALMGYWLAGARPALLLAAATFIGAFIPLVGAGTVVVASAILLALTGHSSAAIFLGIWGIAVVSSIDNFVKPYLMRGRLEVNTGVIFFSLLGGVASFGPVGLIAGPLVVAFFLAVVRMCQKELSQIEAEGEPRAPGV
jgi:predicted PurR-regulated permease PerM